MKSVKFFVRLSILGLAVFLFFGWFGCGGENDKGGGCWPDCPKMMTVPAGKFWMGCNEAVDNQCDSNEYPYHEVYLDAYEIDKTEVTVEAYADCVNAGKCSKPGTYSYCKWGSVGKEQHPVNCVEWYQAKDYCEWAGKRLPTEAEWEKAARGGCEFYNDCKKESQKYPWGNEEATCEFAVMNEGDDYGCGTGSTMAVGSKPKGASPYGALDMSGNVWEWVNDWYDENYYGKSPASNPQGPASGWGRVKRGGGFYHFDGLRASNRYYFYDPSVGNGLLGFRCARSK